MLHLLKINNKYVLNSKFIKVYSMKELVYFGKKIVFFVIKKSK